MSEASPSPRIRSSILYAILCAPLVFLLMECVRGAYCDYQLIRTTALQQELSVLRSESLCNAAQLETVLQTNTRIGDTGTDWSAPWVKSHWTLPDLLPEHETYAAVVDRSGRIVLHTNHAFVGGQLEPEWYQESVAEGGLGVVRLHDSPLSGNSAAYDARVPILVDGRRVGEYHQGLDGQWFDNDVWNRQKDVLIRWGWLSALALVVDAAAVGALVTVARRNRASSRSLSDAIRDWGERISKISWGLAHEIRNPLHTLRINVYLMRRSFSGNSKLEQAELMSTLAQSDRAVDILEGLTRDLLQFTTPVAGAKAEVSVASEIRATLNLMNEELKRKQLEIRTHFPSDATIVAIDPGRLRQMLMNVLTFAEHNAGQGGVIEIDVKRNGSITTIDVLDNGSTLTESEQSRVFEPFYSARETGSVLGLALVKHFAEGAGGSAACLPASTGCLFRIRLPLSGSPSEI